MSGNQRPQTAILSVEDDDSTFYMITIAFEELGLPVFCYRAVDGEDALHFLHQKGAYLDAPRPALILMNVNLPKVDGIELLSALKSNLALASIPVVMFTSSSLDEERARCLALGAKAYISKPMEYGDVLVALKSVFSMAAGAS